MTEITGVLYEVPTGAAVGIPKRHLAAFGVTRDSGKTTFIESAAAAEGKLRVIVFRTKRGELGFESARKLPLFFDEKGLTHWKAFEGLLSATLEEKVQREPGVRAAIMTLCNTPTQAKDLHEILERAEQKLANPKLRGFHRDVYTKIVNYMKEVLPQLDRLRGKFTETLELDEPGVYVMDLIGDGIRSDDMQNLFVASVIRKVYEAFRGVIIVVSEIWKFIPQDRGSPVKWVIEKFVREMGVVDGWMWLDAQDLRGVDKKHLRSFDVRLFGRQPDHHEVEEILKELPLDRDEKPTSKQIMTLKLGHFYAKLGNFVKLVYVRPVWLPEEVAVRVAKGEIEPTSDEVQKYNPKNKVMGKSEMCERCAQLEKQNNEMKQENRRLEKYVEDLASGDELKRLEAKVKAQEEQHKEENARLKASYEEQLKEAVQEADLNGYSRGRADAEEEAEKKIESAKQAVEAALKIAEQNDEKAKKFDALRDVLTGITAGAPVAQVVSSGPSFSMADVDERLKQLVIGPAENRVVTVDVDERIKEIVTNEYITQELDRIRRLSGLAVKAAQWLHQKQTATVSDLYFYLYQKQSKKPGGAFYNNAINPLVAAWLIDNDNGTLRWILPNKLKEELHDVVTNPQELAKITTYLTSFLLK